MGHELHTVPCDLLISRNRSHDMEQRTQTLDQPRFKRLHMQYAA